MEDFRSGSFLISKLKQFWPRGCRSCKVAAATAAATAATAATAAATAATAAAVSPNLIRMGMEEFKSRLG